MSPAARALFRTRRAPLLLAAALAACAQPQPAPRVPEPPPMLAWPVEYAFGDAIAAADSAAIGHVVDLLRPSYGAPKVTRYTAPANADLAALKAYYDGRAASAGWRPIEAIGSGLSPGEHAVGYRADGAAFAVVWLAPRPGSALVPVNVIRFQR